MSEPTEANKGRRGPKPETLKIEGNWAEAVKKALKKGKPPAPAKNSKRKKRL